MNKIVLILISIFLFSALAYSQKKKTVSKEKVFFGVSIGPSLPENDFKNKDVTPSSGYAMVGYKIQAYGGVNLMGGFGIALLGFTNINKTDPENLKTSLDVSYPGNSWIVSSKYWHLYGGMMGPTFYYPLGKKINLDVKILAGLVSANTPELLFQSGNNSYKIESQTSNSFSYMTALGLNFDVGQNVSLTGGIDFMGTSHDFNDVKTTAIIDGVTTESTSSFSRVIEIINLTIGFRYSIR